jgi:hypothetical protein
MAVIYVHYWLRNLGNLGTLFSENPMFIELINANKNGRPPLVTDWVSNQYEHIQKKLGYATPLDGWWEVDGNEYTLAAPSHYWPTHSYLSDLVTHAIVSVYRPGDSCSRPLAHFAVNKTLGPSPLTITWPDDGILKVTLNHG